MEVMRTYVNSAGKCEFAGTRNYFELYCSADLLTKLAQFSFRLSMIGMLLQQFKKHLAGFLPLALDSVNTREIQIRLVVLGCHPDGLFKSVNGLLRPPSTQIKHAKIVQSLGINRAQTDGAF